MTPPNSGEATQKASDLRVVTRAIEQTEITKIDVDLPTKRRRKVRSIDLWKKTENRHQNGTIDVPPRDQETETAEDHLVVTTEGHPADMATKIIEDHLEETTNDLRNDTVIATAENPLAVTIEGLLANMVTKTTKDHLEKTTNDLRNDTAIATAENPLAVTIEGHLANMAIEIAANPLDVMTEEVPGNSTIVAASLSTDVTNTNTAKVTTISNMAAVGNSALLNHRQADKQKMMDWSVWTVISRMREFVRDAKQTNLSEQGSSLVAKATKERIYPVGRLDRNTTGLLLLTNDGSLAEKLSHPRNSISKLYHVELDKNLTQGDFNKIEFGITLEDGVIKPDDISYIQGGSKREIGIQIHSGKNRIVRRIFESLGYEVVKLDRVVYANLTKKDLPRGRWRYLEERELIQLKHLMK